MAVLPRYFVAPSLARGRVRPLHDHFRLVYRVEDEARVEGYRALAKRLIRKPLA